MNGIISGSEWQCVELINRLYITRGWIGATWHGNGGDSSPGLNDSMFDRAPGSLSKQANGSISHVAPGDVVSINGLSLNSSGSIAGTPVAEGPFPITVTVTDSAGTTASASLLLNSDGPQLLPVRQGSPAPVLGKIGLTGPWTPLTSLTGKIAVAGNRIAVRAPGAVLWAKDGLDGTWYQEANGVTAYALDG